MGKTNEIQKQMTQSYGDNAFTTTIKDDTVEFDSLKDKFTFKDEVNVPSLTINGQTSQPFTTEEKTKLSQVTTPMQIKGRVDSVEDLPTEGVKVGDTYLVGLSGSETFEEYVCVELSGSPEVPVWEIVGSTQVQADWNQNDNTKADFIKNRICYEVSETVIFTSTSFDENGTIANYMQQTSVDMSTGVTYTAVIGDNEETVEFQLYQNGESISYGITLSQGGGQIAWAQGYIVLSISGNPALYAGKSFKVVGITTSITKIDEKFIPDSIARTSDIPVVPPTIATNILNGSKSGSIRCIGTEEESGSYTIGYYAFAEGYLTKSSGQGSHAEGNSTTASARGSHAEGNSTTASAEGSHAEGNSTTATGYYSHAEGNNTTSTHRSQHVFGEYNVTDPSAQASNVRGSFVEIVGNGTARDMRSNARTLDWSGNETLAGTLTIGGASGATLKVESGALKVSFDGGTTWQTVTIS